MEAPRSGRVAWLRDGLVTGSGGLAGALLVLMMMVTVIDVCGRYFLNAPLPGAFEMTQFLMAGIVYAGLPRVSQNEGHITIDLLDGVTAKGIARLRDLMVNAVCTVAFGVLALRLWVLAGEAAEWGDVTQYLGWPLAPVIWFGSAMSAIAAVVHLGKVFALLRRLAGIEGTTG